MVDLTKFIGQLGNLPGLTLGLAADNKLTEVRDFGFNPGQLRMLTYRPVALSAPSPLVVALHGCTQSAASYDYGTGWSSLAEKFGFSLLFPEQQRANNQNGCFNWFAPDDIKRDRGEALSIRQMIAHLITSGVVAGDQVYVTGLSAGGAMTAVMLATYPEVFVGGAIIAGLPYCCAQNVNQALTEMRQGPVQSDHELGDVVRGASAQSRPWPRLSVWHGTADHVVVSANGNALVRQWLDVNELRNAPTRETVDGHQRNVWRDAAGKPCVEEYTVANMGHGVPLKVTSERDTLGHVGPFFLNANISSTLHIARFFGLTEVEHWSASIAPESNVAVDREKPCADKSASTPANVTTYVQDVIAKALKSAGLMH